MLSSHTYWNLDGFQRDLGGKAGSGSAEDHELWMQAETRVEVDDDLVRARLSRRLIYLVVSLQGARADPLPHRRTQIPTGRVVSIPPHSACDFYSPASSSGAPPGKAVALGDRLKMSEMRGLCGPGACLVSLQPLRTRSRFEADIRPWRRTDCAGLDTAFVLSQPERQVEEDVVMRLQSRASGIRCVPAVLRLPLSAVVAKTRRDC